MSWEVASADFKWICVFLLPGVQTYRDHHNQSCVSYKYVYIQLYTQFFKHFVNVFNEQELERED